MKDSKSLDLLTEEEQQKEELRAIWKAGFVRGCRKNLPQEEVANQLFEDWYKNDWLNGKAIGT